MIWLTGGGQPNVMAGRAIQLIFHSDGYRGEIASRCLRVNLPSSRPALIRSLVGTCE
jgi:hypothetical protein